MTVVTMVLVKVKRGLGDELSSHISKTWVLISRSHWSASSLWNLTPCNLSPLVPISFSAEPNPPSPWESPSVSSSSQMALSPTQAPGSSVFPKWQPCCLIPSAVPEVPLSCGPGWERQWLHYLWGTVNSPGRLVTVFFFCSVWDAILGLCLIQSK